MTTYKIGIQAQIAQLESERNELRNELRKHQRQNDPPLVKAVRGQVSDVSRQLRELRKEMALCEDITLRSSQTREELEWLMEQQEMAERKEGKNDELLWGRSGADSPNELGGR